MGVSTDRIGGERELLDDARGEAQPDCQRQRGISNLYFLNVLLT